MTTAEPPPVPHVRADRDAFVAGHDQHFYGFNGPAFTIEAHRSRQPGTLAELAAMRDQPSTLLNAHRQVVGFTGRVRELEAIGAWRDGATRHAAWLIHAAGGQGKSRLAARAGDLADAAGWTVTYARHRLDTSLGGEPVTAAGLPLLVIVDYAERWPKDDLHGLLSHLAGYPGALRVLLLARSIGWWAAANTKCVNLDIITNEPLLLPPLADDEPGRRVLFDAACHRFAEIYQATDLPVLDPAGDLSDPTYSLTLGLHMAALVAVDAYVNRFETPHAPAGLSQYLLDRECDYWERLYGDQNVRTAARSVFLAVLAGPLSHSSGTALLERANLPKAAGVGAQRLLDLHALCYPPAHTDTVLEPLYPDRLAEDFIALTLPGPRPTSYTDAWAANLVTTVHRENEQRERCPGRLFTRDQQGRPPVYASRALIFLAATATRFDHVAERLRTLLTADPGLAVDAGSAALLAVVPHTHAPLARAISRYLPPSHVDLAQAAAVLSEHRARLTATTSTDGTENLVGDIHDLATLAYRLSDAGRGDDALGPATEVVGLVRHLAETDSSALPYLAVSLSQLGRILGESGRWEEGLATIEEATKLYRHLVDNGSAGCVPDPTEWLGRLSAVSNELGWREECVAAVEEATDFYRNLVDSYPSLYLGGLAECLTQLGDLLARAERREEALAVTEEATNLFRRLPDAKSFGLLFSFSADSSKLAAVLRNLRRHGVADELIDAHQHWTESVKALRAEFLNGFARRFGERGCWEEAPAQVDHDVVDLHPHLAAAWTTASRLCLATSLRKLGIRSGEVGRWEEALAHTEEATHLYRHLASTNPTVYLPELGQSLATYIQICLQADHDPSKARYASHELIDVLQRFAEQSPQAAEAAAPQLRHLVAFLDLFSQDDETAR